MEPLGRGKAWLVAVVATLTMTVSYIDRQAIAALSPSVMSALHMTEQQFGWLTSAFSVAYLVGAPLAGFLLDRVGVRRGLVLAVLAWSAVAAGHALVTSFAMLVALRVALGTTESPSFPGAASAVRRTLPAKDRSAGLGLVFTGSSIGAMIAPPLAIGIAKQHGWAVAFVGVAACGLLWIPLWLLVTGGAVRQRLMPTAVAERATGGLRAMVALLGEPQVRRAVVLVIASAPGLMFVLVWYGRLLSRGLGVSQADLAHYLWFPPLVFDLGAVAFGALASRLDRKSAEVQTHRALCITAAVLASALVLAPATRDPMLVTLLGGISMAGGGGCYVLATADMLARTDLRRAALAGGFTAAAQSVAQIIASPLIGYSVDRLGSFTCALAVLGGMVLPGAIVWVAWPMPSSRRQDD